MPEFRICRSFTVESGHMLSRHPERCRFPHGHTRRIEVVVAGPNLDENGMLLDFKALKLALQDHIERYDHSMALNSADPALAAFQQLYPPDALVVFPDTEPTTEVIAKEIFDFANQILRDGFSHHHYRIEGGKCRLERVRVWETPNSWAEYGE